MEIDRTLIEEIETDFGHSTIPLLYLLCLEFGLSTIEISSMLNEEHKSIITSNKYITRSYELNGIRLKPRKLFQTEEHDNLAATILELFKEKNKTRIEDIKYINDRLNIFKRNYPQYNNDRILVATKKYLKNNPSLYIVKPSKFIFDEISGSLLSAYCEDNLEEKDNGFYNV